MKAFGMAGVALASLVAWVGCGDDSEGPAPFQLKVATFNMALTVTVKGSAERFPAIVDALGELDADVVCLQEAFVGTKTPAEVADALADAYPYAYESPIPNQAPWGPGVLLVSRHPLTETDALRFVHEDTYGIVDRSAISADIALDGRTFRVACTHLSAGLDEAGITLRGAQLDEIFSWLDAKAAVDGPTFLVGDFNMGPDPIGTCTPNTEPACVLPDTTNYDRVLDHFDDLNADLDQCTQCKEQFDPLQVIDLYADEPNQRIDHCFVRDLAPYVHTGSDIVLDAEISIPFEAETLTHLSDHRGVRCEVSAGP